MYQLQSDTENIYLQLKDYKSRLLSLDTHVELYIDDEFFASRYYGDTIRIPISTFSKMRNVKMISFDNNNCVHAIDIMENTLCYDAKDRIDFYDLAEKYSNAKNLFISNSDALEDISYLQYFIDLESLYFEGNDKIDNYLPLLNLPNLTELSLKKINDHVIQKLNLIEKLDVLELTDCKIEISLGEDFANLSCKELKINNCPNLSFDEFGLFSVQLERLSISYNYSLNSIGFIAPYPNMHIIDLSYCDGLSTMLNTVNLPNLNMLTIDNCQVFDLSQPLDNIPSLMHVTLSNNPNFAKISNEYIKSIWANSNLIIFDVTNCNNINEIDYFNKPWKKVN